MPGLREERVPCLPAPAAVGPQGGHVPLTSASSDLPPPLRSLCSVFKDTCHWIQGLPGQTRRTRLQIFDLVKYPETLFPNRSHPPLWGLGRAIILEALFSPLQFAPQIQQSCDGRHYALLTSEEMEIEEQQVLGHSVLVHSGAEVHPRGPG